MATPEPYQLWVLHVTYQNEDIRVSGVIFVRSLPTFRNPNSMSLHKGDNGQWLLVYSNIVTHPFLFLSTPKGSLILKGSILLKAVLF